MKKEKTMVLTFLPTDFTETSYRNSNDCAITRAGFDGYHDEGIDITDERGNRVICVGNKSYDDLVDKVIGMYAYAEGDGREWLSSRGGVKPIEPAGFTHTLYLD